MARGVIGGMGLGLVLIVPVLLMASLVAEQPPGNAPPALPVTDLGGTPDGQVVVVVEPEQSQTQPEISEPEVATAAPQPEAMTVEDPVAAIVTEPQATTDAPTAAPPEPSRDDTVLTEGEAAPEGARVSAGSMAVSGTETAPPELTAQETVSVAGVEGTPLTPRQSQAPAIASGTDSPVLPSPLAAPPQAPDDDLSTPGTAAPDPAPEVIVLVEEPEEFVLVPETESVSDAAIEDNEDTTVAEDEADTVRDAASQSDLDVVVTEEDDGATVFTTRDGDAEPADIEIAGLQTDTGADIAEDLDVGEAAPATEPAAPEEETAAAVPSDPPADPVRPTVGFGNRDTGVTVIRPGSAASPDEPASPAIAAEVDPDAPPVVRFAAQDSGSSDAPAMSVVMIDRAGGGLGPVALTGFPFPVSIAIDPATPDANARMMLWREAGFEVLSLANVPEGARPSDVEVAFEVSRAALPEAVGVIAPPDGGIAGDRALIDQLAALAGDAGMGLVAPSEGLTSGVELARQAGVPAAEIFRDLDGAGQDARVIGRFLDQAAFRARQQGPVVLIARLRPETISAMQIWGAGTRAGQVQMRPASAVMSRE